MRDVADLLRTQLDDVRKDRDHWRSQAETIARQITHDLTAPRQPSRAPAWLLWTVGILIGAVTWVVRRHSAAGCCEGQGELAASLTSNAPPMSESAFLYPVERRRFPVIYLNPSSGATRPVGH